MSDLVVDPCDSTKAIVMKDGVARLAGTVWVAPVGADISDREQWTHVGFADPDGIAMSPTP